MPCHPLRKVVTVSGATHDFNGQHRLFSSEHFFISQSVKAVVTAAAVDADHRVASIDSKGIILIKN
jgi:hypothetical protein